MLNSGGWITIAVDTEKLYSQLVDVLKSHEHVESAQIEAGSSDAMVHVQFKAGSEEAKALAAWKPESSGGALLSLVSQIEEQWKVPVQLEVSEAGRLAVGANLKDLTLSVAEALQALPAVEYAQPNYTY